MEKKVLENFDAIIVLGRHFEDEMLARLKKAEELYEKYKCKVIFTGANKIDGLKISEVMFMKKKTKIPLKDIILEKKSRNTMDNALFCRAIVLNNNFERIIVVTSPYHVTRAFLIFKNIFSYKIYIKMETTKERYNFKKGLRLFFMEFWRTFYNLYEINFKFRYRYF